MTKTVARPPRGKVLVVDDDRVALEVARERLEGAGYEVITRDSALGTSAVIQTERPDIVLLDVQMPGLSGTALAKFIGEKDLHVPIILHSASDRAALREMAHECGAVGLIMKTDDEQSFLLQFDRCMGLGRRLRRG